MQNRLRLIYTFPYQKNYMSSRILCVLDMTFRSIVDERSTISTITFDRQTKVCEFIEILLMKINFFFFLSFVFFLQIGCCYFLRSEINNSGLYLLSKEGSVFRLVMR